jgi:opacity protein-like surface antigen
MRRIRFMKKLIAIAVVFALVAGAAFAETSVSGTIDTRITVVKANNDEDSDATIGGSVADGFVQLSGQDDDGKFGGLARIRANENGGNFHRAFAWWQPIPQLRIFLGHDLDGKFGTDPLTAWGFHQGGESFVSRHDWDFWRAVFPGNWDGFGLSLSVFPAPGIDINLVIPTGLPEWYPGDSANSGQSLTWKTVPSSLRLESGIGIPDVGKIYISYIGPRGTSFKDSKNFGQFGGSFLFTMLEGLQIQAGVSTYIKNKDNTSDDDQYPIMIGLAAHYSGGDFGVKFRSAFVLKSTAGFTTTTDSWRYRPWIQWGVPFTKGNLITFNVMPFYNLGVMTAYLDIGAAIGTPDGGDANIYFWLNPYVRKSIGPGAIRAGIMVGIDPDPVADTKITFDIPVQFTYSF